MKTIVIVTALLIGSAAHADAPKFWSPLWTPLPPADVSLDERPIEQLTPWIVPRKQPTPRKPIGVSTPFTLGTAPPPQALTGPPLRHWNMRKRCWPNCPADEQ